MAHGVLCLGSLDQDRWYHMPSLAIHTDIDVDPVDYYRELRSLGQWAYIACIAFKLPCREAVVTFGMPRRAAEYDSLGRKNANAQRQLNDDCRLGEIARGVTGELDALDQSTQVASYTQAQAVSQDAVVAVQHAIHVMLILSRWLSINI